MGSSTSKLSDSDFKQSIPPTWKHLQDKYPKGSVQVCVRPPKYYINYQK